MTPARDRSVFVNCPFDDDYKPIADAIYFAIQTCGYIVRSAAEIVDSGELRLLKIIRLIEACDLSIHDLSRVELDSSNNLPRFNMPLELGITFGMKYLGAARRRHHVMLILDSEKHRYKVFASDLAGVDASPHGNDPKQAISKVRNFLATHQGPLGAGMPGGDHLEQLYCEFENKLPALAAASKLDLSKLEHIDRVILVRKYLEQTRI